MMTAPALSLIHVLSQNKQDVGRQHDSTKKYLRFDHQITVNVHFLAIDEPTT
jgi:hypothetical protein